MSVDAWGRDDLRKRFNEGAAFVRVIALVSPT